jgi:hypothetical protein
MDGYVGEELKKKGKNKEEEETFGKFRDKDKE